MSEKQLLLSEASSDPIEEYRPFLSLDWREWLSGWRLAITVIWGFFVLIGVFSVLSYVLPIGVTLGSTSSDTLAVGPGFSQIPSSGSGASAGSLVSDRASRAPVRLQIASIGVDAKVESVGIEKDGSMATPSSFTTVGWYQGGSLPGDAGNAVIDGHVNNALTDAGVFEHLDQVSLGDIVSVTDASGKVLRFRVISEQVYAVDSAPTAEIFAQNGPAHLVLVTCNGAWDKGKKMFNERLVLEAELVSD